MKTAWIAAAALVAAAACAETTPLWPEGKIPYFQPNQIAAPSQEAGQKGFDRAAHTMPYLDWSPKPAKKLRSFLVLCAVADIETMSNRNNKRCLYLGSIVVIFKLLMFILLLFDCAKIRKKVEGGGWRVDFFCKKS